MRLQAQVPKVVQMIEYTITRDISYPRMNSKEAICIVPKERGKERIGSTSASGKKDA